MKCFEISEREYVFTLETRPPTFAMQNHDSISVSGFADDEGRPFIVIETISGVYLKVECAAGDVPNPAP